MCDRGRGNQLSESKNNDDPRRSALAPTSPKWCRGLDGSDMFINMFMKMVPGLGRQHDFDDAEIDVFKILGTKNRHRRDAESATGVAKKHMSGSKSRRHLGFARAGEMAPGLGRKQHFHRK